MNSFEGDFHCEDCEEFIEAKICDYCNLHGRKADKTDAACVEIDLVINEAEQVKDEQ